MALDTTMLEQGREKGEERKGESCCIELHTGARENKRIIEPFSLMEN